MIDTASGGALVDKTPEEARRLIANMAANSQQLAIGNMQTVKVYEICSGSSHATDMCPALQEDESMQHANAVVHYGQPQRRYDPYSNTYNPGWRDHPNLSYGNQPVQNQYQQQIPQVNQPPPPPPPSNQVFQTLNLGPLKETSVIIQLADRSNAYPLGVVEDVLVQVRELIFPVDFYILDMEDSVPTSKSALILFGRPFLKTAKTKIDVDDGTLTMEFDGETIKFNIFDAMKYPADDHFVFSVDVVDTIVQDVFELSMEDELEVVISQGIQEISTNPPLSAEVQEVVMALQSLPPVPKRYEVPKIDLPVSHTKCYLLLCRHQSLNSSLYLSI
ncbi:hypothetical protein P3X46_022478 [Hevea brasiliensis]|uniref:Uncharacterized protein n=1 Tax=Hevea brasiliensis TaxID=3981 RepID=A0ABQ9L9M0_HEVBR|nr:hypothetical protein P3X46_022478 [Hevea brasiliensis]